MSATPEPTDELAALAAAAWIGPSLGSGAAVVAVLLALLLLLVLKKKKTKKQSVPGDNGGIDSDEPIPPMEDDSDSHVPGEYISEYGLSDVARRSDGDPGPDPLVTLDVENEDELICVSEYGLSDYGQLNAHGDLEDGPRAPQPDEVEDEVEYAAEYGLSDQGVSKDDQRDDLPIAKREAEDMERDWLE